MLYFCRKTHEFFISSLESKRDINFTERRPTPFFFQERRRKKNVSTTLHTQNSALLYQIILSKSDVNTQSVDGTKNTKKKKKKSNRVVTKHLIERRPERHTIIQSRSGFRELPSASTGFDRRDAASTSFPRARAHVVVVVRAF